MIKKTLCSKILPVMLSVVIVTVFMYIYDNEKTVLFALFSFIINSAIFLTYDFFSSKGNIGKYCSILGGFAVIVLLYLMATSGDSSDDGLDFMVWFLSPHEVVQYSLKYICTLFVGLCFFIASTIYYFTQVRYRIFVTFMILMIPLAIFAKENERVPVIFLAILLALYIAVMIHCRQTADSEKNKNIRVILDGSYRKSAAIFVFVSVITSFAVPKPEIEANREYFESMIYASSLTQYLLDRLGDFSDTSGGSGFSGKNNNSKLFYIYAEEPLNLKSKTFTNYSADDDKWYINLSYDRFYMYDWQEKAKKLNPAEFLNAVYHACGYSNDFAEKYDIEYKNPDSYDLSVYSKSMGVIPVKLKPYYLLSPSHSYYIDNLELFMSQSGGIIRYSFDENSECAVTSSTFIDYYSDMLSDSEYARGIIENLSIDEYDVFLGELYLILLNNSADGELLETVELFKEDYENAVNYFYGFDYPFDKELDIIPVENGSAFYNKDGTISAYLRDGEQGHSGYQPSSELEALTLEITKDCHSDIEKAEAIELYFINNGFTYDSEYQKPEGSNVDTFLFESKKGACYEYATAMVLMARSAGLPARYNEGFVASNYSIDTHIAEITENNSHAYPEVFISGYGWLVFEPTLVDVQDSENKGLTSQQILITIICLGAGAAALLGLMFIKFVWPEIYEKYFRFRLKRLSAEKSAILAVLRLRTLTGVENSVTADEFAAIFAERYSFDISNLVILFNSAVYAQPEKKNIYEYNNRIFSVYIEAAEKIRISKKKNS